MPRQRAPRDAAAGSQIRRLLPPWVRLARRGGCAGEFNN